MKKRTTGDRRGAHGSRGGEGGYSSYKWVGVCLRHDQNLTLSQFASRLKRHPVPIWKLTPNFIDRLMV